MELEKIAEEEEVKDAKKRPSHFKSGIYAIITAVLLNYAACSYVFHGDKINKSMHNSIPAYHRTSAQQMPSEQPSMIKLESSFNDEYSLGR